MDWTAYNGPAELARKLKIAGIIPPIGEYIFHETRLWRFDLAWPDPKIAIEVQGGFAVLGAHARIIGAMRDMEKHNAAILLGWRLFYFTPQQIADDSATIFFLDHFTPELSR